MYPSSATNAVQYQGAQTLGPPVERVQLHAQATELHTRLIQASDALDALLDRINGPRPVPMGIGDSIGKMERQLATVEVVRAALQRLEYVQDKIQDLVSSIG